MFGPEDYEINLCAKVCRQEADMVPAQNEQYENFIVRYKQNMNGLSEYQSDQTFQIINETFGILYVQEGQVQELEFSSYSYSSIPKCYTYMDLGGLRASGVTRLQDHPYLKLRGEGTMIAVIDSGIDYRLSVFQKNGRTRISSIWDQTVEGRYSDRIPFGKEYTQAEINRALTAQDPLAVVPSVDNNGHGTRLAAIAAGNMVPEENFSGAAPESELIIIKLKPAKKYLRDFYLISENAEVFQEDDIMLGISYALRCAGEKHMPLSICIGLGTNMGAHRGTGPLNEFIDSTAGFGQNAVSIAVGNEGAARHHFMGRTETGQEERVIDLHVGREESEQGFSMEFWGNSPNFYNLAVQSPTGERLAVSTALKYGTQRLSFVFVETKVMVNYVPVERRTGLTLAFFRFLHPAGGIWKLIIEDRKNGKSGYHFWLPVSGMISDDTYFLEPSPYYTVTSPGDAQNGMTVTAYDYRDNSLYIKAGRGYNADNIVKPDFAAPGVEIRTVSPGQESGYGSYTGTSLAAAQTAGIAALMFEWAVIRGNEPYFTGESVKNYLKLGAIREAGVDYPNRDFGFGRVDLYHTFELLT